MNAQTLIDSTPSQTFEFSTFWKSNSSQVNSFNNFNRGDKRFVARQENKHPQVSSEGFVESQNSFIPSEPHSLMPRTTYNYTEVNKAMGDLEWQQAEKELNLIQL